MSQMDCQMARLFQLCYDFKNRVEHVSLQYCTGELPLKNKRSSAKTTATFAEHWPIMTEGSRTAVRIRFAVSFPSTGALESWAFYFPRKRLEGSQPDCMVTLYSPQETAEGVRAGQSWFFGNSSEILLNELCLC
jgi:hypothetical protein